MDNKLMRRAADNVRALVAQMVEKAKSGHPGGSMGGADFATVLFSKYMVYDPNDPMWVGRDRFFLDPGHMSPMLYAVLAMTGRYPVEELEQFRQWGSVTPGHPELDPMRGVDNGSGPLGQGHAMAVGCAIAERYMAARFGEVVSHKTYAFISDGGIQEEVSQGAGRIAGTLGLHNLIMFYDSNDVQLSTMVSDVTSEDTAAKYRAWGWNVLEVDGTDPEAIGGALSMAQEEHERPTLIIGHTVMAKGVVKSDGSSLEGAISTHGQPLSKAGADIDATIRNLGGDPAEGFKIWDDVQAMFDMRRLELSHIVSERKEKFHAWKQENPELAETLGQWMSGKCPDLDWSQIELKPNVATRTTSGTILNFLGKHVGNMIVSSADLANSDKTEGFLKAAGQIVRGDFSKGFLQAGVAELTMACLMNGIVLHGGMIAACGTFFVFSDYEKPAIRMSALMELPVKYIFSHDAFRVGEDGPTHQPVEHEMQMRLLEMMDNLHGTQSLLCLRPADGPETLMAYKMAMENTASPTVLILTRQDVEDIPGQDRVKDVEGMRRGAYVAWGDGKPDLVLVGNGSEVSLLVKVAQRLREEGIAARVVSVPSQGLFMRQSEDYKHEILPDGVPEFGVTAGLPVSLMPVMRGRYEIFGMTRFGASAPAKVLDEKFGFTVENILGKVKDFLKK